MQCIRCKTTLLGEVLVGRGSANETSRPRITGLTCWKCGNWIEPEFVPVVPMSAVMLPDRVQQYVGGRKPGAEVSPAVVMVKRFFDEILKMRRKGTGWETITKLLRQATRKAFCEKTLERYWLEECVARQVQPPPKRGEAGGKKSAALRAAQKGVAA